MIKSFQLLNPVPDFHLGNRFCATNIHTDTLEIFLAPLLEMQPSSSTPALHAALLASVTLERPRCLLCANVATTPQATYDPLGSGVGRQRQRQDSRPTSVSGGLIGNIFEDPKAVLNARDLSGLGQAPPSRTRRRRDRRTVTTVTTVTAMTAVTLRVMHELHQCHVGFYSLLPSKGTERVIKLFSSEESSVIGP